MLLFAIGCATGLGGGLLVALWQARKIYQEKLCLEDTLETVEEGAWY